MSVGNVLTHMNAEEWQPPSMSFRHACSVPGPGCNAFAPQRSLPGYPQCAFVAHGIQRLADLAYSFNFSRGMSSASEQRAFVDSDVAKGWRIECPWEWSCIVHPGTFLHTSCWFASAVTGRRNHHVLSENVPGDRHTESPTVPPRFSPNESDRRGGLQWVVLDIFWPGQILLHSLTVASGQITYRP